MKTENNGGPAFPFTAEGADDLGQFKVQYQGMTLRDYLAAHASDGDVTAVLMDHFDCFTEQYSITRQQARYIHADAMLQERSK